MGLITLASAKCAHGVLYDRYRWKRAGAAEKGAGGFGRSPSALGKQGVFPA